MTTTTIGFSSLRVVVPELVGAVLKRVDVVLDRSSPVPKHVGVVMLAATRTRGVAGGWWVGILAAPLCDMLAVLYFPRCVLEGKHLFFCGSVFGGVHQSPPPRPTDLPSGLNSWSGFTLFSPHPPLFDAFCEYRVLEGF